MRVSAATAVTDTVGFAPSATSAMPDESKAQVFPAHALPLAT